MTVDFKRNSYKVGFISLGCAKNQVDTELMIGKVTEAGYVVVNDESLADVIVVNTCAFIESAREEAINTILETAELKQSGKLKVLVVAGCLSQRYKAEIAKGLPEVDCIVGINDVALISDLIDECIENIIANKARKAKPRISVSDNYSAEYINGPRVLTTPKGSAYIKIAEGCDNRCAYCAIPQIRGAMRSRRMEDIVGEAKRLILSGVFELNIIAQDTSRYGRDIYGEPRLADLIRKLDALKGNFRIRVMYLYPDEIVDDLLDAFKNSKKVVHYIDLPLQHVSTRLLAKMNRRGDKALIEHVIESFRKIWPDAIVRSSFILGFPGETEEDFLELCEFVQKYKPDRIGAFTYSREEGTDAYYMTDKVNANTAKRRRRVLMELAAKISLESNQRRVGTTCEVLTEGVSDDGIFYIGRSYGEAPDQDGVIYFTSEEPLEIGDRANVKIVIGETYDMTGSAQ